MDTVIIYISSYSGVTKGLFLGNVTNTITVIVVPFCRLKSKVLLTQYNLLSIFEIIYEFFGHRTLT